MRNVHDFRIDEKEFLGYLFNYRKSLIINKSKKVEKGEYARLFEVCQDSYVITGRSLLFKILEIGKIKGMSNTEDVYYIDLEKIMTE